MKILSYRRDGWPHEIRSRGMTLRFIIDWPPHTAWYADIGTGTPFAVYRCKDTFYIFL